MIVGLKRTNRTGAPASCANCSSAGLPNDVKPPATGTIHAVLYRNGLVQHQGRPRHRAQGTTLSAGAGPSDLWCADFKGEFRLGNGQYC